MAILDNFTILLYRYNMNACQLDLFAEKPDSGLLDENNSFGYKEFFNPMELQELDDLYELSVQAYFTIINAQMHETFQKNHSKHYLKKIMNAVREAEKRMIVNDGSLKTKTDNQIALRAAAENAAFDRGDALVREILDASHQVGHEIHRLFGLLRFNPNKDGIWLTRCAPDHYILPVLSQYFLLRFCDDPWAIIDEKRGMALVRLKDEDPCFGSLSSFPFLSECKEEQDEWEDLWRSYHQIVNIENRKNPLLQRQLMPARYWKYLPEKN